MSLNVCVHCTARFAIGVAHCPQCGNADYHEEGSVAKISRHGGATHIGDTADVTVENGVAEEVAEPADDEESEDEDELVAEAVPTGTIDEVILWTEGDAEPPARLLAARDAEAAKPTPRSTLMSELERRIAKF